ncbi:MAG: glycosyltransferase family 2 protein [Betaproteobacteria bacterium]|nr:glycosyltransferase family 2 protein [Betaproteobacteria bacterium]
MSGAGKLLSVVVPVFRNEANLPETVPRLLALKDQIGDHGLELVFVDDGSDDGSYRILEDFAAAYPRVIRVIKLSRNFGQTPAIQAGLRVASGEVIGIISADLQEPPEAFAAMIRLWEKGAKFVIGERQSRAEGRMHQKLSGIYWNLVRRYAFPDFPRLGYDFCVLDRSVVDEINRINEKNTSIFVLIYWLGYRPARLPISRQNRARGTSQWRLGSKFRFTIDTLFGFTYVPARFITFAGMIAAVFCLAYFAYLLANWFLYRAAPPGWMTVAGLLTLLGALLLFSLGIISEYLMRILDEARKRPPYVIEKVISGGKSEPTSPE